MSDPLMGLQFISNVYGRSIKTIWLTKTKKLLQKHLHKQPPTVYWRVTSKDVKPLEGKQIKEKYYESHLLFILGKFYHKTNKFARLADKCISTNI